MTKGEAIRRSINEITPVKTRLMDCVRMMGAAGARREAQSLDRIIPRLGAWQHRV